MMKNLIRLFSKEEPKQKLQPQIYVAYSKKEQQTNKIQQMIVKYQGTLHSQYQDWKRLKFKSLNVKKVVQNIQGSSFIDPEFPHNNSSISQENSEINFQWKRIPDFIKYCIYSSAETFQNFERISISNKKLKQALLFMYRTHPSKFKQLLAIDCNSRGLYQFTLYHKGIIQNVIIDDYVPVVNGNHPLMTGPVGEIQIFPMLLEKAIAKICGAYDKIPEDLDELLQILFCGPLRKTKINQLMNTKIVSKTIQNTINNRGMAAFISKKESKLRNFGICQNQIYHIIDKFVVHPKNQGSVDLYELISEKKIASWNGKYSHNDSEWDKISANQRNLLFKRLKQNNSFFISGFDAPKIFDHLIVFHGTDILNKQWIQHESQVLYPSFSTFQLRQTNTIFIRVSTNQPVRTSFILAKIVGNNHYKYIKGTFHQSTYSLQITEQLSPGKYVICVHHDWILNKSGKYSIFLSSDCHTQLFLAKQSSYPNFLQYLFKGMSQQAKRMQPTPDFLSIHNCYCIGTLEKETGFAFVDFSLKNRKQKQVFIQIQPKILSKESWEILQPNSGRTMIHLQKQNQQQLLLILKTHKYVSQQMVQFPSTAFKVKV